MRRHRSIAVASCIGYMVFAAAHAQQPDIATDNELYAAYCIGALRAGFETDVEKARAERFRGYLAARGAFTNARSRAMVQGINIAVEHGYADGLACHRGKPALCAGPDRCATEPIQIPF